MHMSDALISPAVGIGLWGVAGVGMFLASRKIDVQLKSNPQIVPLMGVMGAFVFAAQMVNIAIPGTGASGHLTGAILLAAILGPSAAFIAISSILLIQALLFADGGLLAYGANVLNLGLIPCFVVFPLIWRPIAGSVFNPARILIASVLAGVLSLVLGAAAVTLETYKSGITALPLFEFLSIIIPIHFVIGIGEGLLTGFIIIYAQRKNLIDKEPEHNAISKPAAFGVGALLIAGGVALLASDKPDGLEWSVEHASTKEISTDQGSVHTTFSKLQESTSIFPDYDITNKQASSGFIRSLVGILGGILIFILLVVFTMGMRSMIRKKNLS